MIYLLILALLFFGAAYKISVDNRPYTNCLNPETYKLLKESPHTKKLCKYEVTRDKDALVFRNQGYTLFVIKSNPKDEQEIILIGLDGYGLRDREFHTYLCGLIGRIRQVI